MSIDLINQCWHPDMPVRGGAEQLVLIRLCEIARQNGDRVVISEETLAEACHCSDRHVRDQLRELERKGLVRRPTGPDGRPLRGTGPNHCNEYYVTLPDLAPRARVPVYAERGTNGVPVALPAPAAPHRNPDAVVGAAHTGTPVPPAPEPEPGHTGTPVPAHRNPSADILPSVSPPPPRGRAHEGPEERTARLAAWVGGGGWTTFQGRDLTDSILAATAGHPPDEILANLGRWRRRGGEPIHLPSDYQGIVEKRRMRAEREARAAAGAGEPAPPAEPPKRDPMATAMLLAEHRRAVAELGALWTAVRSRMPDDAARRLWLETRKVWPRRLEGARLVLAAPTQLFADTIAKRFAAPLAAALAQELAVAEASVTCDIVDVPVPAGSAS
jgi:hypothetical protein